MTAQAKCSLDDLPRFSPWPARLLGLQPWRQKLKTPEEIAREYEGEKWGPMLRQAQTSGRPLALEAMEAEVFSRTPATICSVGDDLVLLSAAEMHQRYLDFIASVLESYCPANALVELGAGYGSILLALAKRGPFRGMRLMAGDYTRSGVELIRHFASIQGTEIEADHCDFNAFPLTELPIPCGAIVYTVYGLSCIPELAAENLHGFANYRPRVVVNFEPCLEHCGDRSLLGLLRRRYIELNDYNRNLVTLLHELERAGSIEILEERSAAFGKNPLFPASVLAWRPRGELSPL